VGSRVAACEASAVRGACYGGGGYAGCAATPGYTAVGSGWTGQRGVLKVHLRKGVGLKAADLNGKSDPYVIASCGGETKKSRVVPKTLEPVWNEVLEFSSSRLDDVLRHGLSLKVMDKDTLTKDDALGEVHVALDALRLGGAAEFSEPLPTQGSLVFSVSWEAVAAEQVSRGTLHVLLQRASGLKAMDRNGKSDPYAKLTLQGVTHKSKTIKKTLDPEWNESFKWSGLLRELSSEPLQLHLFDYDFARSDDKLGHASVDLRGLTSGEWREYAVQLSEQGTVYLSVRYEGDGEAASPAMRASTLPLHSCGVGCGPPLPGRPAGPGSVGRRSVAFSSPPSAVPRRCALPTDYGAASGQQLL